MWRAVETWISRIERDSADIMLDAVLAILLAAIATNILQFIFG